MEVITNTNYYHVLVDGVLTITSCVSITSCVTEEVFSKKQLIVLHVVLLLLMTLATITLPHLTAGNLVVFTCIRRQMGTS